MNKKKNINTKQNDNIIWMISDAPTTLLQVKETQ